MYRLCFEINLLKYLNKKTKNVSKPFYCYEALMVGAYVFITQQAIKQKGLLKNVINSYFNSTTI